MPTGYTACVLEGASFKDFALGCAKAFGACIDLRDMPADTPIPEKFDAKVSYYVKKVEECQKELDDFLAQDLEIARVRYEQAHLQEITYYNETKAKLKNQRKLYDDMLAKVKQFIPPTVEHMEYKKFMINQLKESRDFDCRDSRMPPIKKEFEEWVEERRTKLEQDLKYFKDEMAKEIKRTDDRNVWISKLRKAINEVPET